MSAVRVLLAHEHRLIGEALADVMAVEGLEVAALVSDGRDAVLQADRVSPDVVVLRPDLPRLAGLEVCRRIRASGSARGVVVLDDDHDIERLLQWVKAGADGYVPLAEDLDDVVDAVRRVADGEMVLPPDLLRGLLQRLVVHRREADRAWGRLEQLTRREREVLEQLALGVDQGQVADTLGISTHTVRTHIQNILGTLQVHSRLEAVTLALTSGWLEEADQLMDAS